MQESTITAEREAYASDSQIQLIGELYAETNYPEERRYPAKDLVKLERAEASTHIELLLAIKRGQALVQKQEAQLPRFSEPTLGMCAKMAAEELARKGQYASKNTQSWTQRTRALYHSYEEIRKNLKREIAQAGGQQ